MLNRTLAGFLLCLLVQTAWALDDDVNQPAFLDADDMEIDFTKGVRIYRGNVVFTQGSMRLNCDKLVTYLDDNQALEEAICTGEPARFKQRLQNQDTDMESSALKITLNHQNDLLLLESQARIEQGDSIVTGDKVSYNLATRKARITGSRQSAQSDGGSESQGSSRVRMVIQPGKKETE